MVLCFQEENERKRKRRKEIWMHQIFLYFAALHYNILMLPIFLSPGTRFVGIECSCPEHGRTNGLFQKQTFST